MVFFGRRVLFVAAAAFQSAASVERAERGRCLLDLFEDRSVSRRRPRPGADRYGDRDDGVRGQRDVSPLPSGRPSGRDQLAGLAPLLPCPLGRGGPCRFDITAPETILTMPGSRRAKPVQHLLNSLPHPLEEPLHQAG